jgi:hypothetical protein
MIKKLRPKYRVLYTFRALYGSMYRGANRVEGKLPSLLGRACEAVQIIAKGCCYAYSRQD